MLLAIWTLGVAVILAQTPALTGDVYVPGPPGASISIDGQPTGLVAPATVPQVSAGPHSVSLRLGCAGAIVPAEVRPNAIERLEPVLIPAQGKMAVTANVPGAEVRVDGTLVGALPLVDVPLACGRHTVDARAPGYGMATREATIVWDERIAIELVLVQEQVGSIAVGVRPTEAEVYIDQSSRGVGPMTVNGLAPGVHIVEARLKGYSPANAPVSVVANQATRIDFALIAIPSLSQRLGLDRVRWWQVGTASGLSLMAVGGGIGTYVFYQSATEGYAQYGQLTYADDPDGYYEDNVEGPRSLAIVSGVIGGVSAVGAGVLWATLTPVPSRAVTVVVGPGLAAASGSF